MIRKKNDIPLIMGIVNGTTDSFYKNSRFNIKKNLSKIKYKHADIIDIGFESTRPGAIPLALNEELSRLSNFLKHNSLNKKIYSIDTYKPDVAKLALNNGFKMINDIKSGNKNFCMFKIASDFKCPIVLMHMLGEPSTMQQNPYYDNVIDNLLYFFEKKIKIAQEYGIKLNNIILDPGIGFGKTFKDNINIINNINIFKKFGTKLLIGISRKSFLSINNDKPDLRLPATIATNVILIQKGIDIIRVHDVEETYKANIILQNFLNY